MTKQHPITPPPELVEKWISEIWHEGTPVRVAADNLHIAAQSARWGADQELKACCEWLENQIGAVDPKDLRKERRPKVTERAEQIMYAFSQGIQYGEDWNETNVANAIREVADRLCTDLGELQDPVYALRKIADEVEELKND